MSRQIEDAGLSVEYETDQITYTWPERQATYTPDFKLPKQGGFFYVETKGILGCQRQAEAPAAFVTNTPTSTFVCAS